MPRITKEKHPDLNAYNECVDGINSTEQQIERLLDIRDRMWLAADAIHSAKGHGAQQRPRNPNIKNGYLQR